MNFKDVDNVDELLRYAALSGIFEKHPENPITLDDLPLKARDKYVWTLFHNLKLRKNISNDLKPWEEDLFEEIKDYIIKYFGISHLEKMENV